MQKQLFSMMLGFSILGGLAFYPTSTAMAAVAPAPTIKVTGKVVDENGEPLIGATVKVKNSKDGTITDFDGNFTINVPGNAVLVVSYVSYKDREVAVRNRAIIEKIQLDPDAKILDQVVVVGYGTQKKADLTGSVAVVNADELKRSSNSNVSTMLEGKVSGVQVTSSGEPGADPTVRIRGISNFGDSSPLYVIDGVPMGTVIRDFSPNDIETIQILKDASAAAIYGSRAANGVVIITTKNGKKDQPLKIDYKGYFGVDHIQQGVYDMMNADQYSTYLGQACNNSGTTLPGGYHSITDGIIKGQAHQGDLYRFMDGTNTNWIDEVFKNGIRQNHNINLSGGGAHNAYNISFDYYNQKGTLQGAGPNYERFTTRINNTFDAKWLKVRTGITYTHSNEDGFGIKASGDYIQGVYGMDGYNVLSGTLAMQPTIKAYDSSTWCLDDKVGAASSYQYDAYGYGVYYDEIHGDISASNPLLVNNLLSRNTLVDRFLGTATADVDILGLLGIKSKNHQLTYRINLSYNKTVVQYKRWIPAFIQSNRVYLAKSNEMLEEYKYTNTDGLIENTLTYDGKLGKHHINFVLGQTYEENLYHIIDGTAMEFAEPYYLQLSNGTTRNTSSTETRHALASYFGRLNYDFAERYLISAIVRRDGSSRLVKDRRWGTFPSVSLGWRLDKEPFWKVSQNIVNMLKFRASYGELGNENIGEYAYLQTVTRNNMSYSFGNTPVYGSAVSSYVDTNIGWEKKKSYNVGLDLALFNNRVEFSAEWYKNISSDLLFSVAVPANTGFSNDGVTMNSASMENTGVEFSVTYRNHDHPFKYDISGNIYTNRNKVTALAAGQDKVAGGYSMTYVGQEAGQFYGYVFEGIARTQADLDNHATQEGAQVGDCLYKDLNGDGKITADDQTTLGSGMPKANFGLSCHLSYKCFDLSISTYGAIGFKAMDGIYKSINSCYGYSNKSVRLLEANQWSADGLTYLSNVPRTYAATEATAWNDNFSERFIQDASYWKIANVELGYNFPKKLCRGFLEAARIYASVQNLYTFTGYKGYNVDFVGSAYSPGYNWCSYPSARTIMVGVNLSFGTQAPKKKEAVDYSSVRPVEPRIVEKVVEKVVEKPVEVVKEVQKPVETTYIATFAQGSFDIDKAQLDNIPAGATVEIVAYASPEGSADINQSLSQKRADAVANYLKAKGINVKSVTAKGADSSHANRIAIVTIK